MRGLLEWISGQLAALRARLRAYSERVERERKERDEDDDTTAW